MKIRYIILLSFLLWGTPGNAQSSKQTFAIGDSSFLLNGKPYIIRCGEMHYARIPKEYWRHRLQMIRAMGLNTVCAYLFWNFTEKQPGEFNWTGQANVAEFCKIAQEEGLYVILRPGPYSCAEWDFGGLPWWLLKDKNMAIRTRYKPYLDACRRYLIEVGKQLVPMQITNGGNILMVQVENEYGSYGKDKEYIGIIRDYILEAGFTVPLFTCDGPWQLVNDVRPDIFAAVNFGDDPEGGFKALRAVEPKGPLFCSEYYPGWFDSWGKPHHKGVTENVLKDLKYMLDHKASFSIYMAHGGTTFGTYNGANAPPFIPQTSSYDYDAPINESGQATEKFHLIRNLLSNYLQEGETIPVIPAEIPAQKISNFHFSQQASLWNNLPKPVQNDTAMLMEDLDQAYGAVLYQTKLKAGNKAVLQFHKVNDYALVYLDKTLIGTLDRIKGDSAIEIPARKKTALLEILVEGTGRINYGRFIHDRKGIHGSVILEEGPTKTVLKNWANYPITLGEVNIPLQWNPIKASKANAACFYKGSFSTTLSADTYLDMRKWNKGLVWVNGHCLGRYWNIGPTQTIFLPGCWLKNGENEVVIFDLFGASSPQLQSLDKPVLDELTIPQIKEKK